MPMPPYPVPCQGKNCTALARFKVAAVWSDGITSELKTYSLACAKCLLPLFSEALERREACCLAPGEKLERPRVYSRSYSLDELSEMELQVIRRQLDEDILPPYRPLSRP